MRPQETSARPRCTRSPPKKTPQPPGPQGQAGGWLRAGAPGAVGCPSQRGSRSGPEGSWGVLEGSWGGRPRQILEVLGESDRSGRSWGSPVEVLGGSDGGGVSRGIPEGSWRVVTRRVRNPTTVLHRLDGLRKQRIQIQSGRAETLQGPPDTTTAP